MEVGKFQLPTGKVPINQLFLVSAPHLPELGASGGLGIASESVPAQLGSWLSESDLDLCVAHQYEVWFWLSELGLSC